MVDQAAEVFASLHFQQPRSSRESSSYNHLVCNHAHNHVTPFCDSGTTLYDNSDMTTVGFSSSGVHHISSGVQNIAHTHRCNSTTSADLSYSTSTRSQSYDSGLVPDLDSCATCTTQHDMDLPAQCFVGSVPNGMPAAHTLAAARNIREKRNKVMPARSNSLPMINPSKLQRHTCTSASEELLEVPRTNGNPHCMLNMSSDSGLDSNVSLSTHLDSCVHTCPTGQSLSLSVGSSPGQSSSPSIGSSNGSSSPERPKDVPIKNLDEGKNLETVSFLHFLQ